MHCVDVKYYLNDYLQGILLDEVREEIHDHLNYCPSCAKMFDNLIVAGFEVGLKKKSIISEEKEHRRIPNKKSGKIKNEKVLLKFFPFIPEKNLNREFFGPNLKSRTLAQFDSRWLFILSVILTIASAIILAVIIFDNTPDTFRTVEKISGYPIIGSQILIDEGKLRVGEKLITDSESRARLKLESIGEIDIEPKTEIQFIETKTFEQRLILAKGQIAARTWIKPKTFSIETPSAIITDLGCEYNLVVNDRASTSLYVESGWVQMQYKNTKALLCAGTMCISDSLTGVGTPFFKDATKLFKESLYKLDISSNNKSELVKVLSESRPNDLISLFNLLKRLDRESRRKIFDRISSLFKIPKGITREGIMNGNDDMMGRLWTGLGLGSISMYHNL
jgi:hypothetical protein